jgi:hypothetical protein
MNMTTLQDLTRHGFLPSHLATCQLPKFSACQLGKQRRLARNKGNNPIAEEDITKPGD